MDLQKAMKNVNWDTDSKDVIEEKCLQIRYLLSSYYVNLLQDLDKVACKLSESDAAAQRYLFPFKFTIFLISKYPSIFLSSFDDNRSDPQTGPHSEQIGFLKWIMYRLLTILVDNRCWILHEKCKETMLSIIYLLQSKNVNYYSRFLIDIYKIIVECVISGFGISSGDQLQFNQFYISQFCVTEEMEVQLACPNTIISIVSLDQSFLLLRSLFPVIEINMDNFACLCSEHLTDMWNILLYSFEMGIPDIKSKSLACINRLVDEGYTMDEIAESHASSCIGNFLELVCSNSTLILSCSSSALKSLDIVIGEFLTKSVSLNHKYILHFLDGFDYNILFSKLSHCQLPVILEALCSIMTSCIDKNPVTLWPPNLYCETVKSFINTEHPRTFIVLLEQLFTPNSKDNARTLEYFQEHISNSVSELKSKLHLSCQKLNSSCDSLLLQFIEVIVYIFTPKELVVPVSSNFLSKEDIYIICDLYWHMLLQYSSQMSVVYESAVYVAILWSINLPDIHDKITDFIVVILTSQLFPKDERPSDHQFGNQASTYLNYICNVDQIQDIDIELHIKCLKALMAISKKRHSKWIFKCAICCLSVKDSRVVGAAFDVIISSFGQSISGLNGSSVIKNLITKDLHSTLCSLDCKPVVFKFLSHIPCLLSGKLTVTHMTCKNELQAIFTCSSCTCGKTDDQKSPNLDITYLFSYLSSLIDDTSESQIEFVRFLKVINMHAIQVPDAFIICVIGMMNSPHYKVRKEFELYSHHLVSLTSHNDIIISEFCKTYHACNSSPSNLETAIRTAGSMSLSAEGKLLLMLMQNLLHCVLSDNTEIAYTAHTQLYNYAKANNTNLNDILMRFKKEISQLISDTIHEFQFLGSSHNINEILLTYSNLFGYSDITSFLNATIKEIIPNLVIKTDDASSVVIREIAKLLEIGDTQMILDNMSHIFVFLVCASNTDIQKPLAFLEKHTGKELDTLLRWNHQQLINELLIFLSSHYTQVFNGIRILAVRDTKNPAVTDVRTKKQLVDYLQPRLLGVFSFFDTQLLSSTLTLADKILTLKSLISLIGLTGTDHITAVRVKVSTSLKICLQINIKDLEFLRLVCEAWHTYIRHVDVDSLGPMLSQIVAILLPLLDILPDEVAQIYSYFVLEQRDKFKDFLNELFFLPIVPELGHITSTLMEFLETPANSEDLTLYLERAINGISHESSDVNYHSLQKLKQLLQMNKKILNQLIESPNETVHPVIAKLVLVLVNGCRDCNIEMKHIYGECLGELGAIDPVRLQGDVPKSSPTSTPKSFEKVEDNEFAYGLFCELSRAFMVASGTKQQDCSAYAIQELLPIYECSPFPFITGGNSIWTRLSQQTREIFTPLLNTRYKNVTASNWSALQSPIYSSPKVNNYKEWVSTWVGHLMSNIKAEFPSKVFSACGPIIKHDTGVALYLLPLLIQYVLIEGGDGRDEILRETLAVLTNTNSETQNAHSVNDYHMCTQTIFSLLDYLTSLSQRLIQLRKSHRSGTNEDEIVLIIRNFLGCIPQDILSTAAYDCQAYTRSLMHYELHIRGCHNSDSLDLGFIQKLYVKLDEPDGVIGVSACRTGEPSLGNKILDYDSKGQLCDSSICYERSIQMEPDNIEHHKGLLSSLLWLCQMTQAMTYVSGLIEKHPDWTQELNCFGIEASWKLSSWNDLETYLQRDVTSPPTFSTSIGRIISHAMNNKEAEYLQELKIARKQQIGLLSAASMEVCSYQRAYENIVQLHMLSELETGLGAISKGSINSVVDDWKNRLGNMQDSFRYVEPVLNLRRVILSLSQTPYTNTVIGSLWLKSAKKARKADHISTAFSSLLHGSDHDIPDFCLERAKWMFAKGEKHQALMTLQKDITEQFQNVTSDNAIKRTHAKAVLFLGSLMEDTARYDSNAIMKKYKEVTEICPLWEDGFFATAKFSDRVISAVSSDRVDKMDANSVLHCVKFYGASLQYGSQYIYQSMPRLLHLWLEFGARDAARKDRAAIERDVVVLTAMNKEVADLFNKLPMYQFFTSYSQLISRICHSNREIIRNLLDILSRLVVAFPQQALWLSIAVSKSTYPIRSSRCQEMFNLAIRKDPGLQKALTHTTHLVDKLLEICNKPVDSHSTLTVSGNFKTLAKMFNSPSFSKILVPLQSMLNVTLPGKHVSHINHQPFPNRYICIAGFEEEIEVLNSLQKPKKITIRGTDGQNYTMMCKPKDDLRKDSRLMDFNDIVNKFLRKGVETRRRWLHIRTYAVVPLNEECGLLEWVTNTSSLRHILTKLYREKSQGIPVKELKLLMARKEHSEQDKLTIFTDRMLPRYKPIFWEWFLRTFPDPTVWYSARLSYARTLAVMSMVGYILGLGDRHGENVLFDSKTGDTVHVDFNCLFNKGETFEWPEKVPFRLTHNMVDALGPTGIEGVFRSCCEGTMKVLRDQREPLMCILKPFIYDPLVEWSRSKIRTDPPDSGEITNEKALTHVSDIDLRLQGILKINKKSRGLPLSVEGYVDHLIQEATSLTNLSQMYIGWAPYL